MGYLRNSTQPIDRWSGGGAALCALVSLLFVACSGDDDRPRAIGSGNNTDYCSAMCSWYRACGHEVSPSCVSACRFNGGGLPSYARQEFFQAASGCLADDTQCAGGEETSWQVCMAEAAWTVQPTQAAYDLCEVFAPYFFECGYTDAPAACAGEFMYYSDHTLPRLSTCADSLCGEMPSCIDDVIRRL